MRERVASYTDVAGELCAMAPAKRPAASGLASNVVTTPAPADSPNNVTRSAAPPKAGDVVAHPAQREQHVA